MDRERLEFLLTKLATQLIEPLSVSLLLTAGAAFFALREKNRSAAAFALLALAWLWLCAAPASSGWLRGLLERQHPPLALEQLPSADAIVLLGGAVQPIMPPRRVADLNPAADRLFHAARLYRAGKAPWVIASGGPPSRLPSNRDARLSVDLLVELGVPSDHILVEEHSQNTHENCVHVAQLLRERGLERVLLVTSALHMPRALATCRASGIDAVPATADVEVVRAASLNPLDLLPDSEALDGTTRAVKELVGALVYRLRGWLR